MAEEFDYTSDDPQAEFQRQQFARALQMGGNYVGQKMAEDTAAYHANPTEWAMNKGITNAMGTIGVKADAPAVAMDELSRLARAKKMGFNTSETWYHGTPAGDIPEFDPYASPRDTQGQFAGFFTKDPKFANEFTKHPDPSHETEFGSAGNIIPTHLKTKKTFDFENEKHIQSLIKKNPKLLSDIDMGTINGKPATEKHVLQQLKLGNWGVLEEPSVVKAIKDAGFDSMFVHESGRKNMAVFEPNQIRSKFAEFDPKKAKKSGLSYASGGLVKQLSGFKKIKSSSHVTVLKHPAGHEISIAHAGLGDGLKRQLESMPVHLDEGGAIPIATDPAQAAIPEALANPSPGSGALAPNGVGSADIPRQPFDAAQFGLSEEEAAKVRESLKSGQPYESPGGEEMVPTAAPKEDNEIKPASASYRYNIQKPQVAPPAQPISYQSPYEMEAKAAVENEKMVQNLQATTKGHLDALTQERENLLKDYNAGHVDPNKYLHDLDAGGKATTAIGLLLGGISSGLTGKSNPAIDYLHNQIENSIKSQTLNLGKTQSMLDMNLKQFGNIRDATDMTRAIASDYLASKMKEAETKIKDPMARQQMLMAISQLQNQANGYTQQVASRQGVKSAAKQGGVDPTLQIRVLIPDPHEQEPYFKELQTAQNMSKQRDNLMQTFDELSQVNTVGHTLAHPIDTHAVNQRAMAQLAALAKESEGRVTEGDVAFLQGLYPKRGTSPAETMKRRQAMLNYVSQKMNFPRLDSIGVVIPAAPNFIKPNPGVTSGYSAPAPMQVGYHQ